MFIAFVLLIAAVAIASKAHERTSRNTWTWLALAAVAQIVTFVTVVFLARGLSYNDEVADCNRSFTTATQEES